MVSRVLYRPFEDDDFDAIASILEQAWHTYTPNDEYNFLEACADLAWCLSASTFSQVAVIDGEARGLVLARAGARSIRWTDRWLQTEHDFVEQMRAIDPTATEAYLEQARSTARANSDLLSRCNESAAEEITLLVVSETTRGLGVGSVLLDAAISFVGSQGARSAYLYTDTDCSFKFYERHGFKRRASHKATWEERRQNMPREMYLYTLDLSA